jgi:mono/diheme cytochrome c family protein
MRPILFTVAAAVAAVTLTITASAPFMSASAQTTKPAPVGAGIERGRYLVKIGGCHDCHTAGYGEAAGKIDEKASLTGTALGWRGPWGTTYASNLRLVASDLTEAQWLVHARSQWRPPMPWFNLRDMSDEDLVAIHRYLRHLGPAGERVPAYLPPGQEPPLPYVALMLPRQ